MRAIEGEEVEQIAEIHVDLVAERDDRGESDRPRCAAHSTSPAAMAPDCEISARSPLLRHVGGEARIELGAGRQHAEAIGADDSQPVAARRPLDRVGERSGSMAEPRRDDDRGAAILCACRRDHLAERPPAAPRR